jgi:phenylpropionate dioxygenase-like ring-hydroxylating dioxygenase large terminal subunit
MVQSHFPVRGWTLFSLKHPVPLWGSTQPSIRCILGFVPRGKSVGFELHPLTSFQTHFYLPWLSLWCALWQLQYFHDTRRVNGNRASFIRDTDIDLRESSTVSITTELWTGRSGVWFTVRERDVSLLENVQTDSRAHPAPFSGYRR